MLRAPILAAALVAFAGWWPAAAPRAQSPYTSRIDLVGFTVTVVDRQGEPVPGLAAEDFEIVEDGVPQKLSYFAQESSLSSVPLHLGLLFDTSESMERDLTFSRGAAIRFLNLFPEAADFTLVDFDTEVRSARFAQVEFPRLVERIRNRPARGFTALYDAISVYLGGAFDQSGRKVLVIYTDGGDTTSSRSWIETIRILRASDVTVYPIGFMGHQTPSSRFLQQSRLKEMARLTGGLAFFPEAMKEVDGMYAQIGEELHAQYTIGYVSANSARDGTWRKVNIRLKRPGADRLAVRTREGYFAPVR